MSSLSSSILTAVFTLLRMSLNPENETSRELNGSTSPSGAITHNKPVVVGIYGVSGCGKTYLMNQLKVELGQELFEFYEGSEVIDSLVPGGLEAFKKLDENKKQQWRELAIDTVRNSCIASGKAAVVRAFYVLGGRGRRRGNRLYTTRP